MLNILNISGGIIILLGILLVAVGIRQGRKRISDEENFIPAEAEIIDMQSRIAIVTINHIPIIAREYRPVIRFTTYEGIEIRAVMPYSLKISDECRELFQMYESHTAVTIRYNPKKPDEIYYHSKKSFRIREVVYKICAAAVLIFLGLFMIWGSTLV